MCFICEYNNYLLLNVNDLLIYVDSLSLTPEITILYFLLNKINFIKTFSIKSTFDFISKFIVKHNVKILSGYLIHEHLIFLFECPSKIY